MDELRTGVGWDVHALVKGRKLILGGVEIPSEFGLKGHSDGDVLMHAVTDALFGAVAQGDIGEHFPSSNPKFKGAPSSRFLEFARGIVEKERYTVGNVDANVVLQRPQLSEYRGAIRASLASLLGIDQGCISVKFKTADKLGPVGQGKAAEAHAIVTLVRRGGRHRRGKAEA